MQMVFQVQNFLDFVMLLFICFLLFHVTLQLPHSTFDNEIIPLEWIFCVVFFFMLKIYKVRVKR